MITNGLTECSLLAISNVQVFKFGGASVRDADAVRNLYKVLQSQAVGDMMIVVSAMGKTTNSLEKVWLLREQGQRDEALNKLDETIAEHQAVMEELFAPDSDGFSRVNDLWEDLKAHLSQPPAQNRDYEYDRIISAGELVSTTIISTWLNEQGYANEWLDARQLIRTDSVFREGGVRWEPTIQKVNEVWSEIPQSAQGKIGLTQGFIASDENGETTTLGREGSDYTAAILAFALKAEQVIIWKDVPGMLNADPKYFAETTRLPRISFKEAIELSYFGASVIHPKTIKPLQNAGIPLFVKSFLNPEAPGTEIQPGMEDDAKIPSYIFKTDQVLVSISPRDFSFIVEENLSIIFALLARERIRVNLMQNSALSFSICANRDEHRVEQLIQALSADYEVRYNAPVTLLTIRHYTEALIDQLLGDQEVLVEQRSRNTARFVVRS